MIKYEVGKPFNTPCPIPGGDFGLTRVLTSGFDIIVYLNKPSVNEKREFRQGVLRFGIYDAGDVPFFLLQFAVIDMDATLNLFKAKIETPKRSSWINNLGNALTLYLVDSQTNILHGIRLIGIEPADVEKLKAILHRQNENYSSVNDVDVAIMRAEQLSLREMMKQTKLTAFVK